MNNKLKQKIARYFKITVADLNEEFPDQAAKKYGEQKGVTFEMDSLVKTYCAVTSWASGEGYDISWETEENMKTGTWSEKRISIHHVELECMLACFNDMGQFDGE